MFTALTTSPFRGVLEPPDHSLENCTDLIEPPPFNFSTFQIDDNDTIIEECPKPNTTISVICSKSYV